MLLHPAAYDKGAVFHHAIIGPAFLIGLYTRVTVPYHAYFLLEEISTIPLNLKVRGRGKARRLRAGHSAPPPT